MPVQELDRAYSSTSNLNIKGLNRYDVLIQPDPGGTRETISAFDNTIIIAQSSDRISPPAEVQKPEFRPIELAPNLVINPIPKWDMAAETRRFINDINTGLTEGLSLSEAVGKSAKELEMNVRAYDSEIIKSKAVLLHLNRFELVDGVVRIVGNNGKPILDSISAKERRGAVVDASRESENFLITTENNSFAVLMNPAGWHGFTDQYGRELSPHRNAQALVFWKDKRGDLKGLTFHVDLKLEQAKNMMLGLGVPEEALVGETEQDRIVDIVRNPALLSLPEAYDNPFEYVLDKILAARGNHAFRLLQENGDVEIRPIDQVRVDIKRFEQLLRGNQEEEKHIAELVNYILTEAPKIQEKEIQQQIIYRVEKTLLNLTRVYLQDHGQMPLLQSNIISELLPSTFGRPLNEWGDNFAREVAYLKTRAGCSPSMTNTMVLSGISLGSSNGSIGGGSIVEWDADGPLEFECHKCHKVNDRPRNGRRSFCKWCGVKFGGC